MEHSSIDGNDDGNYDYDGINDANDNNDDNIGSHGDEHLDKWEFANKGWGGICSNLSTSS